MMRDLISAFIGITTPTDQLYNQIVQYGWEPTTVKWDSSLKQFVAEAKNPYGQKIKKSGPNDKTALGNLLAAIQRNVHMRTAAQWKLGMWKTNFSDQLEPIAKAYAEAPVYDPKAAVYFKELADDSVRRAQVLHQQLHIEVVDDPEPYANAAEMAEDIHKRRHFLVSRANSEHPIWSVDQNVAFRIVHDVLGHAVSGGDFGWIGENLACGAHFPLLTPTAQQALFTECIAQTAYAAYYRSFGPQKVALFPEFIEGPMSAENDANHRGVHPSQSVAPTAMPQVKPSPTDAAGSLPRDTIAPHQEALGLTPLMNPTFSRRYASLLTDPNAGWQSGFQPLQMETHGVGNAYLDHGDPLEAQSVMDNAGLVDTGWSKLQRGDGSFDRDRAKLAIVNAFRVVLLSPRKDLRWNAIHYQDIAHLPASTDDPKAYWDALENKRQNWNADQVRKLYEGKVHPDTLAQMMEEAKTSHQAWRKLWPQFFSIVFQKTGNHQIAQERAEHILMTWQMEEQNRIAEADEKKPADKQMDAGEIERRANDAMIKRMKAYIKDFQPKLDVLATTDTGLATRILNECTAEEIPDGFSHEELMQLFNKYATLAKEKGKGTSMEDVHNAWMEWMNELGQGDHKSNIPFEKLSPEVQEYDRPYMEAIHKHSKTAARIAMDTLFEQPEATPVAKVDRYGAFMGTHLKAISKISQHADEILDAALEDVKEHDATGHHFRAKVLALGISGVGPKVCSFAWLLLQPMTSQLATIDTHMMDVLGHNYEKEMNNRDYFKFERELAAGRDAAGYSHVPLGAFQWGMWDHKRTGPGSHQDHSAMRVLDPLDHRSVDWETKAQNLKGGSWLEQAPDWWRNTQGARDAVAQEWQDRVAPNFPQNAIPYQLQDDPHIASVFKEAGESETEFHVAFALPERIHERLAEIAGRISMKREKPENYHMTVFWSEAGYDDRRLHEWVRRSNMPGIHFDNARLDSLPAQDDKWAVVVRFDSPQGRELAHKLMDEGEDRGLDIKRFPGGWKAHITVGWSDEKIEGETYPDLEFRAGDLYISIPRPLRKTAEFSKGFEYWWNKEKPHELHNAAKMAEYAVGTKTKQKDAVAFIEDHKRDVKGDFEDFKKKFLEKFRAINKTAGLDDYAPSANLDLRGEWDVGAPGETHMQFIRMNNPHLTTPEIWKLYGDDHVERVK